MNKASRPLRNASVTLSKRGHKPKAVPTLRILPPVDGMTLALAKAMQAAHDFEEAVWSGRVKAPYLDCDCQH